jgi:glucosamine--fructose-6-phosphate aminotransferase (isomerizing)
MDMRKQNQSFMPSDGPYPFEMLREIYEQPEAIDNTLKLYVDPASNTPRAELLKLSRDVLTATKQIVIVASGASRHAGMCGKIVIESLAGIPVEVEHASEFPYGPRLRDENTVVVAITQSGETADTIAALRAARDRHMPTLSISNVVESTVARYSDTTLYTNAGVERAIPATKSFTSQLALMYILALILASTRGTLGEEQLIARVLAVKSLPGVLARVLHSFDEQAKEIARMFERGRPVILAGRGIHYPIALEAALKLKEISYLHAEGYPTGELRHGITALIDLTQPIIVIATRDKRNRESMLRFEKSLSVIQEVRKHSANLVLVVSDNDSETQQLSPAHFVVPMFDDLLTPILEIVPLQLLAYHIAVSKGVDVDHPRNLVKSVTTD